jgi:hypothetical protein
MTVVSDLRLDQWLSWSGVALAVIGLVVGSIVAHRRNAIPVWMELAALTGLTLQILALAIRAN